MQRLTYGQWTQHVLLAQHATERANSGLKYQEIEQGTYCIPHLLCPKRKSPYCTQLKSPRLLPTAPPSCKCTPVADCFRMKTHESSRQGTRGLKHSRQNDANWRRRSEVTWSRFVVLFDTSALLFSAHCKYTSDLISMQIWAFRHIFVFTLGDRVLQSFMIICETVTQTVLRDFRPEVPK